MRTSRRVAAATAALMLGSGLVGLQSFTAAQAVGPVRATYTPPVDCRPTKPVVATPTPTPTPTAAPSSPATDVPTSTPAPTTPPSPVPPTTPDNFTPKDGTLYYNNPIGASAARRTNLTVVLRSINSSPTCSTIQIATWNLRSDPVVDALLAAAKRGVTVHLIMSGGNNGAVGSDTYNPPYLRLRQGLADSNVDPTIPSARRNWAKTCTGACRYSGGSAHSKYYLFSQVGSARDVAYYGSFNLTDSASYYQWNDLYTVVRSSFYDFMDDVFAKSTAEQNGGLLQARTGNLGMDVYPWLPRSGDPIVNTLNKVRCTSAGAVGIKGRTAVRISVAAILGARGIGIANKLVALRRAGCDVKLIATNLGYNIIKVLQRGGVATRQLVKYDDRQKMYTRYVHTKFVAVSGNYNGSSNQQIVWNGTSNWTALSLRSDELVGSVSSGSVTNKYNYFVNYWYAHTPNGSRLIPTTNQTDGRVSSNPWRMVEQD